MSSKTQTQQHERTAPSSPLRLVGVGLDGYAGGRDAVALASTLADATGASLMLIAVHVEPVYTLGPLEGYDLKSMRKQARARAIETRDSLAPQARVEVQSDVYIWRGLRHVVRAEHADLLVVGSGQEVREGHARLGKWTADLDSHLERPLAIAPRGARNRRGARLERIGVGVDGKPEAQAALELAESMAAVAGADLVVREAERGRRPAKALSELCEQVDLVVLGSGRGGPAGRVVFGPTSRALLRDAPSPIVVAPRPAG